MKKKTKKCVHKKTMRAKSELREVKTSVKMTKREGEIVKQKAKEYGMSVSKYLSHAGVHLDTLSPSYMVHIQDAFNEVYDHIAPENPNLAERIGKEVNSLWSLL